jgi:glyoxylase-like metal-dependent hydrolase (beta-lactamase superfamily II)
VVSGASPGPRKLGRVTVWIGREGGKYPHGNSVLVEGDDETVIIDPSLSIAEAAEPPRADRVLNSHCHEDHVAGNHLYRDVPWHLHELDLPGIRSLEAFERIFGYPEPFASAWRKVVVERFHFEPCADPVAFRDGDEFDVGGSRIRVMHTPGHTRGHSAFWIEPEGVLYLGDIDLSGFGPYYGDAWSDLEDFERSLDLVAGVEAAWYVTFHHIGILEGREAFLERLNRFRARIGEREERLLEFLGEPRTLDEIAAHRFVFRPGDPVPHADPVERRSMVMHVDRLLHRGRISEPEPGRFLATD